MKKHTILLLAALSLILTTTSTWATTYYVNNPGESIQDAIDLATHGDTVIVSPGTYYENIFFNGKNIVLTSTDPYDSAVVAATIIDGSMPDNPDLGSVVTFDGSETTTCVLTGFTIQNGSGTFAYSYYRGGGIYGNDCNAMIRNNNISGNSASWGGGLAWCKGPARNNNISGNRAYDASGAMFFYDGTIQNNIISGNSAIYGGGISDCNGTIRKNTITINSAKYGGGLNRCYGTIQNNTISENSAWKGGGLYYCDGTIQYNIITENFGSIFGGGLLYCDGIIQNNTISGNSADEYGGAMIACGGTIQNNIITRNSARSDGGLLDCDGMIRNNIISENTSSGLTACDGTIRNNTISGNDGFGLALCRGTIVNCIIWENSASDGLQLLGSSTPINSCIQGWTGGGMGNIDVDPLFEMPGYWDGEDTWVEGDYHLLPWSQCVDAGDTERDYSGQTDIDGDTRVMLGRVDMGADEVPEPVLVDTVIVPGRLNLAGRGRWIRCFMWLPEGYDLDDVYCCMLINGIEIEAGCVKVNKRRRRIKAKFKRSEIGELLEPGEVELDVYCQTSDRTWFTGSDVIRVIDRCRKR